jgi:hypothetical protein
MFKALGVTVADIINSFHRWAFYFLGNPFHCDCGMYAVAHLYQAYRRLIDDPMLKVICHSPAEFRGLSILNIRLYDLVCNLTHACPPACRCYRQPATHRVVVECLDVIVTSLPDVMPVLEDGERLVLRFRNTSTRSLQAREYLRQTSELDLRNSGLHEVAREAGPLLKGVTRLDMGDNLLRTLPDTLRVMSPDAVLLDGNPIQ